MAKIEIEFNGEPCSFNVTCDDGRYAEHLTFEEMLGVVAAAAMPENRRSLAWLKTQEEWDAQEDAIKKIMERSLGEEEW